MSDQITVLIPTSPIPTHPSTAIIDATIASIRCSLPESKIIVTCDGEDAPSESYQRYVKSLMMFYPDICIPFFTHVHQSGMLEQALKNIRTPLLFYVEHDWSILPDIPWPELSALILRGDFHSIKLHAQPRMSPYYEHLCESRIMYQPDAAGTLIPSDRHTGQLPLPVIPIIKTRQWSQNPHLASTAFYRDKILPMVTGKCDFIENIVHGIVANSPWDEYKTGIYNPADGDMFRVRHLDGKGDAPMTQICIYGATRL